MSDFFVKDDNEQEAKTRKPAVQEKEIKAKVPAGYIPIKLSSLGKLDIPKVIHVRNYNGEDALKLAMASSSTSEDLDSSVLESLMQVLDDMVFEDIHVYNLHQKEMEEIMINVYINWWSQYIQDYPYTWEEEELVPNQHFNEERIEAVKGGTERLSVSIDLKRLKTVTLPADFKEPISVSKDDFSCKFKLERLGDYLKAKDYIDDKYMDLDNKFSTMKNDIQWNIRNRNNPNAPQREINKEDYSEYIKYRDKKNTDFMVYQNMQSIVEVNGEKVTQDNFYDLYRKIDLTTLGVINNKKEEYSKFGIDSDNVPVVSPITREEVIRRFQFRALDFIPSMDLQNDDGYTVSFGT